MNLGESSVSSEICGSFGYVDPDYQTSCRVSASSDVYSFGVVLLQILSGRKVIDMNMKQPKPLDKIVGLYFFFLFLVFLVLIKPFLVYNG